MLRVKDLVRAINLNEACLDLRTGLEKKMPLSSVSGDGPKINLKYEAFQCPETGEVLFRERYQAGKNYPLMKI